MVASRVPIATLAIVALTTAVVICQRFAPWLVDAWGASSPAIARGEVWRPATGSLVQAYGLPQLVVNMTGLVIFGPPLESTIGRRLLVIVYVGTGALAWLAVFTLTDPLFVGAGASAAVFGVMGASVPVALGGWMDRRWALLSGAVVTIGLALGLPLKPLFGIDVTFAHAYGAAAGILVGLLLLALPRTPRA